MIAFYPHQIEALEKLESFNTCAIWHEMGLGKTYTGAEKMYRLGARINLIICQKSKVNDWVEHMKENYPAWAVYDLTNEISFNTFIWTSNLKDESNFHFVGVINYELTYRRQNLAHLAHFTLLVDESSLLQNEGSKRSKFVLQAQPDNLILLSGTPTSGKYEKLISQIRLLGWNISEELFWNHYVEWHWEELEDGHFKKEITGYKNVDRLIKRLNDHGAVFLKSEDVPEIKLPEKIVSKIKVPVTKEYRKFMKNRIITINTVNKQEFKDDSDFYGEDVTPRIQLVGDCALTKRLYSRMLCAHYNADKLDAFKDLLSSTEDRLIVFYNWNDELKTLLDTVGDRPVSYINGDIKDVTNYDKCDNSITFVHYQAGAMGANLQKANKMIFYSPSESCEYFTQSPKRIHRIGQGKRCFYYYLICTDSIEEDIYSNLEQGRDYTEALFEKYDK